MSGQIFISYRREDSWGVAIALCDRLRAQFGPKQIFMDLDSIELGENFVKVIETTVTRCDVLLAVIGNNWLNAKDEAGGRRLDSPVDWVRTEIETALERSDSRYPDRCGWRFYAAIDGPSTGFKATRFLERSATY